MLQTTLVKSWRPSYTLDHSFSSSTILFGGQTIVLAALAVHERIMGRHICCTCRKRKETPDRGSNPGLLKSSKSSKGVLESSTPTVLQAGAAVRGQG
jgi:hypothetical protein